MPIDTAPSATELIERLQSVLGTPAQTIALHEPIFSGNEWAYVKECIDTGWVSSVGKFVDRFEADLAAFCGAKHAVAVVNGTAAQHVALLLAGVGRGDEVIVPALSFVATANAVAHCGAVPHFTDSSPQTLGMDPEVLSAHLDAVSEKTPEGLRNKQTGRRIAAIVPMHTFGHPVDMNPLLELSARHGIPLIEDAAESLGSYYKGRHTGTLGCMGILSFNGNKVITTGGGGAILTNDSELAKRAKHLTTTAKVAHRWEFFHDQVGYNYRLPNLNAALGCAQLEQLPSFLKRKRALAERYRNAFQPSQAFRWIAEPDGCQSNYWLNAIATSSADIAHRNALLDATNQAGYQCRPAWTLLHKLPMYASCPRADLPMAEDLEARLINLPSSVTLTTPI